MVCCVCDSLKNTDSCANWIAREARAERAGQNFTFDGKEYNYRAGETWRVLDNLNKSRLIEYNLGMTKPERKVLMGGLLLSRPVALLLRESHTLRSRLPLAQREFSPHSRDGKKINDWVPTGRSTHQPQNYQ